MKNEKRESKPMSCEEWRRILKEGLKEESPSFNEDVNRWCDHQRLCPQCAEILLALDQKLKRPDIRAALVSVWEEEKEDILRRCAERRKKRRRLK